MQMMAKTDQKQIKNTSSRPLNTIRNSGEGHQWRNLFGTLLEQGTEQPNAYIHAEHTDGQG